MPHEITHAATQAALAAAILDTDLPPPAGLLGRDGGPVGRRFAVHRATTTFGLIGALTSRFPVTEAQLGAETFADLARAFIARDRPPTALLIDWGDALPEFIAGLDDLAAWPWLADVARLEVAWTGAHHAAEAAPIGLDALLARPPERLAESRLDFHPSAALVASPHPIATIWAAHQGDATPVGEVGWRPEAVLVVRPDADVLLHRLNPAGHAFVAALRAGQAITAAAEAALAVEADFDAGTHLVGLVQLGAVVAVEDPAAPSETAP